MLGLSQQAAEPVDGVESASSLYAEFFRRSEAGPGDLYVELAGKSTYNASSTISRSVSAGEATRDLKRVQPSLKQLLGEGRPSVVLELDNGT